MYRIIYFVALLFLPLLSYGDSISKDVIYVKHVATKYSDLHSKGAMWTEEGKDKINDLTLEEEEYVGVHGGKSISIINGYSIGKIIVNGKNASVEICRELIGYYTYDGPSDNLGEFEFKNKFKKEKYKMHLVKYKKELFLHERENTWLVKTQSFPHVNWKNFINKINIIEDLKNADKEILIGEVTQAKDEYIKIAIDKCNDKNKRGR